MNKKGTSLFGTILLIIGFMIIGFSWYPCISGSAPYDINKVFSCMFNLRNILLTGIGAVIGFIGACLCKNSN